MQAWIYDYIIINIEMADDEDQFLVEPEVEELQDIKTIMHSLKNNPTHTHLHEPAPTLRRVEIPKEPVSNYYSPFKFERRESQYDEEEEQTGERQGSQNIFQQFYSNHPCVYKRFKNEELNQINKITYFSGLFVNLQDLQEIKCSQTTEIVQSISQYFQLQGSSGVLQRGKDDLLFDSRFESGNLFSVFKVNESEYDLVLSNDVNSTGSIQWFYFSVMGMKPHKQYTFSIVNFTKSDSLFNYGMAPTVYSLQQNNNQESIEKGWRRSGKNIQYLKSKVNRQNSKRFYYKLIFTISTIYVKDKLYIAHSYPYTLEKLNRFIKEKEIKHKYLVTRMVIGRNVSKRSIEVLTICEQMNKKRDNRKAIIIMARQHPGQTQSSYVCEGVINYLLSKNKEADFLLKNYKVYVIPMVNIDGVVFGNYRSNLMGKDLNRKWNASQKDLNCPEIICIKAFLQQISEERQIRFLIDLHGHSRKLNSFFYGNPLPDNPEVVRIFPYMCSKLNPCVQYLDCTFASQEYKRKAARIYLSYMFRLTHVYTFESSFFGYVKQGKKIEFTPKEYRELGHTLMEGLYHQLEHEVRYQQSYEFIIKKATKQQPHSMFIKYLLQLKGNKVLLEHGGNNYEGSDSKPEEFEVNQVQISKIQNNKARVEEETTKQVSKSMNIEPKKTNFKDNKELVYHRPIRHLKYIEISKINSDMPNNQLILQPIQATQSYQPSPIKNSLSAFSQTQYKKQLQLSNFQSYQIQRSNLSNSFKCESKEQSKLSMVIKSMNNRNSFIFKYDPFDRSVVKYEDKSMSNKYKRYLKNAFSQTIVTFAKTGDQVTQKHNVESFPLVKSHQVEPPSPSKFNKEFQFWPKVNYLVMDSHSTKSQQKKDSEYYNKMIKKLINEKDDRQKQIKSLSVRRKEVMRK